MSDPMQARLASLRTASKTELQKIWQELFKKDPPPQIRKDLMVPILAYRIQELAFGSPSAEARRNLSSVARSSVATNTTEFVSRPSIKTGTRLVHQWQDQIHLVNAEEGGFEAN
jgi:hypothetical protein